MTKVSRNLVQTFHFAIFSEISFFDLTASENITACKAHIGSIITPAKFVSHNKVLKGEIIKNKVST